jgi:hypothetical protein
MTDAHIQLFRLVMGRDPAPDETIVIMEATDGQ